MGINSREESGSGLNQQRMLFLSCPNASFAVVVVVFQAAWRETPLGRGLAITAAEAGAGRAAARVVTERLDTRPRC